MLLWIPDNRFHCIRCQKCALFTWRSLIEIKSRVQKGEKEVEIANVTENLPSAAKQPTYAVKAGIGSIVLPIPLGKTATAQSQPRSGILSTFTILTVPSFDPDEVKGIVDWVHSFPNTRRMSLSLQFKLSAWPI